MLDSSVLPTVREDMDTLEQVKGIKGIKGWENLTYKGDCWGSWDCSAWRTEGSRKDLIDAFKYLMRGVKKAEAGSSQWHPGKGKEAMDTD